MKSKIYEQSIYWSGRLKKFFLYFVLEYGRLRSGTLLTYLTWLHKLQVLLFFWKSSAYYEKCLSVIKRKQFLMSQISVFEVIDIMITCHSVLSVDILLELKSRNSALLAAVCICLLFIVCSQQLLFLFSLMNSKILKFSKPNVIIH